MGSRHGRPELWLMSFFSLSFSIISSARNRDTIQKQVKISFAGEFAEVGARRVLSFVESHREVPWLLQCISSPPSREGIATTTTLSEQKNSSHLHTYIQFNMANPRTEYAPIPLLHLYLSNKPAASLPSEHASSIWTAFLLTQKTYTPSPTTSFSKPTNLAP